MLYEVITIQPEAQDADHGSDDFGVVVIEIRLVGEKAVPVVSLCDLIPRPIGLLGIGKDDASFREFRIRVRPHVKIAFFRPRRRMTRGLEPGVLIRGVIDDQLGDHLQPPAMRLADKNTDVVAIAEVGIDVAVVGDIVPVIAHRRGIERQQPKRVDPQSYNFV